MRVRVVMPLVALAAGAALIGASLEPQRAESKRSGSLLVGLMDDAMLTYRPDDAFTAIDDLQPGIIRYSADWAGVAKRRPSDARNPDDAAYDFSATDNVVLKADERGIPVLLTIAHTPAWAGGGGKHNKAPSSFKLLEDYSYAVAVRYSGKFTRADGTKLPRVARMTAWNEPNTDEHLSPQYVRKGGKWVPQSPVTYAKLLRAIYTGAHAGARSKGVSVQIAGGVTKPIGAGPTANPPSIAPVKFAQEVGKLKPPVDAWATHPYKFNNKPVKRGSGNIYIENLSDLTKALDASFKPKKLRLWITEFGQQTNPPDKYLGVSLSAQAKTLRDAVAKLRANPRVDLLIWFLIYDESIDGRPFAGGFQSGLGYEDGRKKPAWDTFKAAV